MGYKEEFKKDKERFQILTPIFRLSHPHLFEPSVMKVKGVAKGEPAYSIEMLFDKKTTKLEDLNKRITRAKIAEWGADKENWPSPLRTPVTDGDKPKKNSKTGKMEVKPEHKGMWVVKARTLAQYNKPEVVDQEGEKITEKSEVYPGCYARAYITARPYEVGDKYGVSFMLEAVQKAKEGEAIGGRKAAKEIFGVIEREESESFSSDNEDEESTPNFGDDED